MAKKIQRCMVLFMLLCAASGCEKMPQDPEKTLEKVTGGTLEVGYSENPPWVVAGEQGPTGLEPELITAFANTIGAKIRWRKGTEQQLLQALEKKELHVVMAGLTDDTPWKNKISFTRPYLTQGKKKHVLAVIMGENAFITKLERFLRQQEGKLKAEVRHETH